MISLNIVQLLTFCLASFGTGVLVGNLIWAICTSIDYKKKKGDKR